MLDVRQMPNSIRQNGFKSCLFAAACIGGFSFWLTETVVAEAPEAKKDAAPAKDADKQPKPEAKKPNADAAKKAAAATPVAKEKPAEPLNLDILTLPLRGLFGGGGGGRAVPAMAIPAAAAADLEMQNDAVVQQFMQQYRPIMSAELKFVRLMCPDLTVAQRGQIKSKVDTGLKQAAKQMADQQNRQERGLPVARVAANTDPYKLIRDAVTKVLKETLTEPQSANYFDEAEKRTAAQAGGDPQRGFSSG